HLRSFPTRRSSDLGAFGFELREEFMFTQGAETSPVRNAVRRQFENTVQLLLDMFDASGNKNENAVYALRKWLDVYDSKRVNLREAGAKEAYARCLGFVREVALHPTRYQLCWRL